MSEAIIDNLFLAARQCLDACEPDAKVALSRVTARAWREGRLDLSEAPPPEALPEPGRPPRPRLVAPGQVPRRDLKSEQGRAALVHALAHIEFNAINLAWDAVYRFRGLPRGFYDDWVRVADEEAYHFGLLRDRLRELGHEYGDFDAHNGLWEMACKTAHDMMVRMALVPRVLEARGLDVTPGMMARLRGAGDVRTVSILEIILRDEIGHVAAGTRWFRYACEQRALEPEQTFSELLAQHLTGRIKGPFHEQARSQAGFSASELDALKKEAGISR
jgi:uncharacterized ferritin-like protein (DUF455 family)